MITLWYAILSFMLLAFVVLEGFDIGAGMLHCIVAKDRNERRMVIAAIGPLWTWHEVWLVAFGGSFLMAFPMVMASMSSGFYLAVMLLLWCLIFRGVAMEVGGRLADPLWRAHWNFCFVASNLLLAILIGAALGNIVRGVPVDADGKFALAFFTNFSPYGQVGILDWYTISIAAFTLVTFAAHGANGLAQRTDGPVHDRSMVLSHRLWKIVLALLIVIIIETAFVRPELFGAVVFRPVGWLAIVALAVGTWKMVAGVHKDNASQALVGSTLLIAGMMIGGADGVFPLILRSTLAPQYSISAYHAAAAGNGLAIALLWWPIAFIFSAGYFLFTFRFYYNGKVRLSEETQNPY
jgi:cytochrome d ubiquinol oxidase subunit II